MIVQKVGQMVIMELNDMGDVLAPLEGLVFVFETPEPGVKRQPQTVIVVNESIPTERTLSVSQWNTQERWILGFLMAARELRDKRAD